MIMIRSFTFQGTSSLSGEETTITFSESSEPETFEIDIGGIGILLPRAAGQEIADLFGRYGSNRLVFQPQPAPEPYRPEDFSLDALTPTPPPNVDPTE